MSIRFRCPSGHRIKAADTFAGQSARCPACGMDVVVPALVDPITETGALRILNECHSAKPEPAEPAPGAEPSPTKACPRCKATLSQSARICWGCRLDVRPTTDAWKSVLRAAARHVRGRAS